MYACICMYVYVYCLDLCLYMCTNEHIHIDTKVHKYTQWNTIHRHIWVHTPYICKLTCIPSIHAYAHIYNYIMYVYVHICVYTCVHSCASWAGTCTKYAHADINIHVTMHEHRPLTQHWHMDKHTQIQTNACVCT